MSLEFSDWFVKYAPKQLSDIFGQNIIVNYFKIKQKNRQFDKSTLFTGNFGNSKTSLAKIIAKSIACKNVNENGEPCDECPTCLSVINETYDRDVIYLNGEQMSAQEVDDILDRTSVVPAIRDAARVFICDEMGAPPEGYRTAGRVNPEGIAVLYLSSDSDTVLSEVRASTFDFVTVGEFSSKKEISVANLSAISLTSPFRFADIEIYAANRNIFNEISEEISKPLRRNDSHLEYLPTQYIVEFIKSRGFDGVEFASTLNDGGYNIAIFDETLFECIDVDTVEISKIQYEITTQ